MNKVRCAIYTRKSSEEGLEQDFNSLHAQREACAAYIMSQASEGWSLLPEAYDDGGLSGGTLDRPALQRLLADIEAGKIDIVVVYKVDRLSRSLLDFSKLVETMDRARVSFVSVTQSFNTTTSMGRLTLNMLLSFAQFEREVTAERIRDKIAASKAKGMWMGGTLPLGYEPNGRTLAIVEEDAALVRELYRRYLELGNVRRLKEHLDTAGTLVPERRTSTGRRMGGVPFSRGQLYRILSNPIYIGEIHHKGQAYDGQHEAIVDRRLWEQVQATFADNRQGEQRSAQVKAPSLLAGKVFDDAGKPLIASHACKGKVRYRYYVSRDLQQGDASANGIRIPAKELEGAVMKRLTGALSDPLALLASLQVMLERSAIETTRNKSAELSRQVAQRTAPLIRTLVISVLVSPSCLTLELDAQALRAALGLPEAKDQPSTMTLECPVTLRPSGRALRLIEPGGTTVTTSVDPSLLDLLVKARAWWARLADGTTTIASLARDEGVNDSWVSRVMRLNFLSPRLVEQILEGNQPAYLEARRLTSGGPLPARWEEQERAFGSP